MAAKTVDEYIAGLKGWQQEVAAAIRAIVQEAAPEAKESIKWAQPVYEIGGPFAYIKAHSSSWITPRPHQQPAIEAHRGCRWASRRTHVRPGSDRGPGSSCLARAWLTNSSSLAASATAAACPGPGPQPVAAPLPA